MSSFCFSRNPTPTLPRALGQMRRALRACAMATYAARTNVVDAVVTAATCCPVEVTTAVPGRLVNPDGFVGKTLLHAWWWQVSLIHARPE